MGFFLYFGAAAQVETGSENRPFPLGIETNPLDDEPPGPAAWLKVKELRKV